MRQFDHMFSSSKNAPRFLAASLITLRYCSHRFTEVLFRDRGTHATAPCQTSQALREREGEKEGEEDRSVAPVRTPFALYTLLLYDLCRCRRRRVVIPLLNRRRQTVRGVKYEPKCRCSLLLLCPDSLAAEPSQEGVSPWLSELTTDY